MENNGIRINKFLSQAGVVSRREAEIKIKQNKVKINGKNAILGQRVLPNDVVEYENQVIQINTNKKYYLLNKPKKTICTLKDNFDRQLVTDLINDSDYSFPVGRLDYDTTGVLLITNDGELANKLIHPSSQIKRIYRARINEPLSKEEFMFLNSNKVIVNNKISKQIVDQVENKSYLITICEGSYHHIKKLFELVNKNVLDLKRIEFAGLNVEGLMLGQYRKLKPIEIKKLKALV